MAYKQYRTKEQYPCPGSKRVSDARTWYTPPGKLTSQCTICEECFNKYIKGTKDEFNFGEYSHLNSCNCDYETYYETYDDTVGCKQNGIKVTILNAKTGQYCNKVENEIANLNGVMHVVLPTCTEYMIRINNLNNDGCNYFTFESGYVGDKKIVINDGAKIYYPSKLEIKGIKTGTNDSFMFMSQSNQEKYEGRQLEGENVNNIIKIKVKQWRKQVYRNFFGTMGRWVDCRADESSYSYGTHWSKSNNLSGGATVSGGSHVNEIKTTTTRDTFEQIGGETEFVIQLVCDQDELEKYETNKEYYLKKEMDERNKLLKEKEIVSGNIKKYEDKLANEKDNMDKLDVQLKKYDHFGSINKEDYLMKF